MLISSISPKLFPNKRNAPTNEDNKTGSIFVSKIRSSKYSPDSLHITIPFSNLYSSEIILIPVIISIIPYVNNINIG
ncbi:MAG: hypothetical protein ACXAB8_08180 [Promethearchaeota archaeon]|jgi:hypothetical protein